MSSGATIETISAGLIAAYQSISLPVLGAPTAIGRELDATPPTVPYVEVHVNPSQSITHIAQGRYRVVRRFVVRLYTAPLPDDTPSIEYPDYVKANNCVEAVEDYFMFTADRLNVAGVEHTTFSADTAGVMLYTRANRNYVGVAFEHVISYIRIQ